MRYTHEGLTLWYGTKDTPAPMGVVDWTETLGLVVAVSPANLSNTVSLRYRVDRDVERTVRASLVRTQHDAGHQYFKAAFPSLPPGSRVEYTVICQSSGRQVPDPSSVIGFDSAFEILGTATPPPKRDAKTHPIVTKDRLPFSLEYLCHFTIYLGGIPPETIGTTQEGIKVNWYVSSGKFAGPKLNGKVRPVGGDWMTIRRDGVGKMDVRATLETTDGALIFINYLGYMEFGEEGYDNFLKKKWPPTLPTRTSPRLITAHPQYLWVNRMQCIGIGRVHMAEPIYEYDLYGLF